jgi:hypothetical protein
MKPSQEAFIASQIFLAAGIVGNGAGAFVALAFGIVWFAIYLCVRHP